MQTVEQFWMVIGLDMGPPIARHRSRTEAENEAKRLARKATGTTFVVLEAVTAITKREFDVMTLRAKPAPDPDDDIPF